ncbi:MAG: thioredoxin family protein [Acidimicrobiia bacterium]|nr:thioredoxin family protein [Acidimicrobiia bacterium]
MAMESTMLALGTAAPDFNLPDTVGGGNVNLDDLTAKALVVMFICNHCPYVKHVQEGLAAFGRDYEHADVDIVAISSNDAVQYPDDAPDRLGAVAREVGYEFPVLYDESQEVAKAYTAACTPDFFLFDVDHKLVYRGRFDESRPNSGVPVTGADLRAALEAVLDDGTIPADQFPSMGCGIKWKPGNEPS